MYYVYILFCSDQKLYIGFSRDLKTRLEAHRKGSVNTTKNRRPVQLIYYECYKNKQDAMAREVFLKSGAGHLQIKHQHKRILKQLGYKHL